MIRRAFQYIVACRPVARQVTQSRVAVAEVGTVGNPEEGERPPLEAVTRRLVKAEQTEDLSVCSSEL
jgi:hypothetical protein